MFRDNKKLKKKAKKVSELTKDISKFLTENLKLKFKEIKKNKSTCRDRIVTSFCK